jgi:GlpG protein
MRRVAPQKVHVQRPPPLANAPKYPVTALIGTGCIALTLLWWGKRDVDILLPHSATWPDAPWQLFTSIFFHIDVFHLAFNLYWFWVFGTLLEKTFGSWRFLGIVLLFAVGSSAAEYALLDGGVGLSGVGYGLFGFIWMLARRDQRFALAIDTRTIQVFVGWFLLCILLTRMDVWHVANIAHGAGMLLGVLLGESMPRAPQRKLMAALFVAGMVACVAGGTVGREYVNLSGDAASVLYFKGESALENERYQEAVNYFRRSFRAGLADRAGPYRNLGIALQALKQYPQAIAAYQQSLAIDPHQPDLVEVVSDLSDRRAETEATASAPAR